MAKPLWRWTVGNCLQQGLDILAESIQRTTKTIGIDVFDWAICYNGLNRENLDFLQKAIGDKPIQLLCQDWSQCPIDDHCQTPRRRDGSFNWNGNQCGGSLWKVCPPRLRMDSHEIIMDNDILLLKKFSQIDEFLQSDKVLILQEPIRFYGRYDRMMPPNVFLNSGFMGLPPGYDFGQAIRQAWEENGVLTSLSQADEQGLLMYTLSRSQSIRIRANQMIELLHGDFNTVVRGNEEGLHFTQANRIPNHRPWSRYLEIVNTNYMM